jgi:hypothetical protein
LLRILETTSQSSKFLEIKIASYMTQLLRTLHTSIILTRKL